MLDKSNILSSEAAFVFCITIYFVSMLKKLLIKFWYDIEKSSNILVIESFEILRYYSYNYWFQINGSRL